MTFAEINREIASKAKQKKIHDKEKALSDYILADLIGRSVSRAFSSSNKMPALSEAYPTLFDKETEQEEIQKQKDMLSVLRFKQFAQSYNQKFKEASK